MTEPKLFLRLDLTSRVRLGPGKIRLLEAIDREGSISAAGRTLKMSYRRAWLLIDELNSSFREPLVATQLGGTGGGKASVTALGRTVIGAYRAMEEDAERMVRRRSAPSSRRSAKRRPQSAAKARAAAEPAGKTAALTPRGPLWQYRYIQQDIALS